MRIRGQVYRSEPAQPALKPLAAQAEPVGVHGSSVVAGLSLAGASWGNLSAPRTNGQVIQLEYGETRAAFDLSDAQRIHPAVKGASVVFKRCFAVAGYDGDVRPLVPTAGYRFGSASLKHAAALRPLDLYRHLRSLRKAPRWSWFVPNQREDLVLFQVRAWDTSTGSNREDRQRVNEERAETIRALRAAVGPNFVGGFVPSRFAMTQYPDLLSSAPTSPRAYARLVSRATVGVSTVGLHGSVPWKIAEYLSVGAAVVSEPLMSSFVADPPIAEYRSVAECVDTVVRMLESPEVTFELHQAGRRYYDQFIRPDQMVGIALASLDV